MIWPVRFFALRTFLAGLCKVVGKIAVGVYMWNGDGGCDFALLLLASSSLFFFFARPCICFGIGTMRHTYFGPVVILLFPKLRFVGWMGYACVESDFLVIFDESRNESPKGLNKFIWKVKSEFSPSDGHVE